MLFTANPAAVLPQRVTPGQSSASQEHIAGASRLEGPACIGQLKSAVAEAMSLGVFGVPGASEGSGEEQGACVQLEADPLPGVGLSWPLETSGENTEQSSRPSGSRG